MKQTAVEWLYERLERMIPRTPLYNMDKEQYFKQAKEMEKQQIIEARQDGAYGGGQFTTTFDNEEQYYNETFKNK